MLRAVPEPSRLSGEGETGPPTEETAFVSLGLPQLYPRRGVLVTPSGKLDGVLAYNRQ